MLDILNKLKDLIEQREKVNLKIQEQLESIGIKNNIVSIETYEDYYYSIESGIIYYSSCYNDLINYISENNCLVNSDIYISYFDKLTKQFDKFLCFIEHSLGQPYETILICLINPIEVSKQEIEEYNLRRFDRT